MTDSDKRALAVAERVRTDPYAPRYHFIAPEGNAAPFDPNGALFWNGRYHIFYIFQDPELPHEGHCWGHASSADLIHWTYHPTALAPGPDDPDKGIFSGNAFVSKAGVPTIAYYGVFCGICIAQSTDDNLETWTKFPQNPVIGHPGKEDPMYGVYNVFDPHMWLEGDTYYAILGGRVRPSNIRDTASLFRSDDLVHWEYLHDFYTPRAEWTDEIEDCACPDFSKLGSRYMLACISHSHGARYYLGCYGNETFIPEEHHRMNWPGGPCFAPESLVDDQGQRIMWFWVLDQRSGEPWMRRELGVLSLPRVLSLDDHGRLQIEPPDELHALRGTARQYESLELEPGHDVPLADISGECLEVAVESNVPDGGVFGVKVRMSPDGEEQTVIMVDRAAGTLSIDTTQSALRDDIWQPFPMMRKGERHDVRVQVAPLELDAGEPLRLRVFVDRSVLEVFANRRQCVTQRMYPTREDSMGMALFCRGGAMVARVEAWEMGK